jgi:hypothetical protein
LTRTSTKWPPREKITVTIDDSEITGHLAVSSTKVTGQITAAMGGPHVLRMK